MLKKRSESMTGFFGPIEKQTLKNKFFRQVLYTGKYNQLVVMCLQPGEEIGNEVHANVDQFFRIEEGKAKFILNNSEEHLVKDNDAVVVPAGAYHNVINTSKTLPLKLYTVYSPPNHPDGTIHKNKAEAEAAEKQEHHVQAEGATALNFSAPKSATWWVAVVVGLLGILGYIVNLPVISGYSGYLVVLAFLILAVATVVGGL
jgi:mannose-6-phosphate isomerase-like protein (cupin superfamily)